MIGATSELSRKIKAMKEIRAVFDRVRDFKKEKSVWWKRKRVRCVGGCWFYTALNALPFCVSMQRTKGKCIMSIFSVKGVCEINSCSRALNATTISPHNLKRVTFEAVVFKLDPEQMVRNNSFYW